MRDDAVDADAFAPLAQAPEWRDLTPLPSVEPAGAVCQPGPLTPQWTEAHAYFRAVRACGEVSPRARALTALLIALNPADYTAWAWRYRCVAAAAEAEAAADDAAGAAAPDSAGASSLLLWEQATTGFGVARACCPAALTRLHAVLAAELRYTERLAERSAKNYQLWNHRRLVATLAASRDGAAAVAARELAFTAAALVDDAKNYHAWAHRGWAVALGRLWNAELRATEALLRDDPRNNSAWNARLCALTRRGGDGGTVDAAAAAAEVARAQAALAAAPRDEAVWAYVRGVLRAAGGGEAAVAAAGALAAAHAAAGCPHATAFLADEACARAAAASAAGDERAAKAEAAAARDAFTALQRADPVRAHYWAFRRAAAGGT